MKYIISIVGLVLGIVIDFVTPLSDSFMQYFHTIVSDPALNNKPVLSLLINALGILCAYVLLPAILGAGGCALGSYLDAS